MQKLVFIAQKKGREATGNSKFKKLPNYLLSMTDLIDYGINSTFRGHSLYADGWGGGVGCKAGHNGVGCANVVLDGAGIRNYGHRSGGGSGECRGGGARQVGGNCT